MSADKQGKLIIFEGGDGTGKTTQARRFMEVLTGRGHDPVHIREPGSTPLGERVRGILLATDPGGDVDITAETEMLLYMACRAELFKTLIRSTLDQGSCVLLERSYFSTYAYQGAGLGIDPEMILTLGKWVSFGVEPWRVILLDMEVGKSLARVGSQRDRIEKRGQAYHEKVRKGYLELSRRFPGLFRIIDGDGTIEEVESRIHAEFSDLF